MHQVNIVGIHCLLNMLEIATYSQFHFQVLSLITTTSPNLGDFIFQVLALRKCKTTIHKREPEKSGKFDVFVVETYYLKKQNEHNQDGRIIMDNLLEKNIWER